MLKFEQGFHGYAKTIKDEEYRRQLDIEAWEWESRQAEMEEEIESDNRREAYERW